MNSATETIALAAVGDLGRYVCEELLADKKYDVVVLSRQPRKWLEDLDIRSWTCDYSEESVLAALDSTAATALISFLNFQNDHYLDIHTAFLNACRRSRTCKRLIPSEWAGNIDDFPLLPPPYAVTREPFRKRLKETTDIQWTLFNGGWLMDYFLVPEKSYMLPVPDDFPVNPLSWEAHIRGTGDELQTWTCARDIARAVVRLLSAHEWEPITYVAGEWSTFNKAVETLERVHGRKMQKPSSKASGILDEWMLCGGAACPREKTLRQRNKYFHGLHFQTLEELLRKELSVDGI